jgi:hypothetical protein
MYCKVEQEELYFMKAYKHEVEAAVLAAVVMKTYIQLTYSRT